MAKSLRNLKWKTMQTGSNVFLFFARSKFLSPTTQPDLLRRYPTKRILYPSRVFKPVDSCVPDDKLPLVIDVHGGAFIVNSPSFEDPLCRYLADHGQCMAISIDYSKAPQLPFPSGYEDVVETVRAILDDSELAFDRSKVMLCGSSAGGNLVLAAAQDAQLQGKIHGVMALYPVCECETSFELKMAARPDASVQDVLESSYEAVTDTYFGDVDVSKSDVRLSPVNFEAREQLPTHVYLIGAEHDLLCREAEVMAKKLAAGSEKVAMPNGWQAGNVKWECVNGQVHGFDIFGRQGETKELRIVRLAAKEATYSAMAEWLNDVGHGKGT